MKNSKKCDFKKLALLGITGATMLATGAVEAETYNASELLALNGCSSVASGCGGSQGMGGNSGGGSYQAYRNMPSQGGYYYTDGGASPYYQSSSGMSPQYYQSSGGMSPQYYPSSGCNGMSPQYYQSSGYDGMSPQYYPSSGHDGMSPQYYPSSTQNVYHPSMSGGYSANQPSSGCGSIMPQNYQASSSQPTQGCGGASPTKGQTSSQPMANADQNTYTQWETADNAKSMMQGSKNSMQQDSMMQDDSSRQQQNQQNKKMMTESELMSQLNEEGKRTYNNLDAAGKALALKMASQDTFRDKNLAVKAAALKMSEKRQTSSASSKY
jgi:hypothetical protein